MESGDGLLIRAKAKQAALSAAQLRAAADIAIRCGNGLIDLTQRAQLQLRGLDAATLEDARALLQGGGLYFPADDSRVDILCNGYDGALPFAIDALARAKERDVALRGLPPKFLVSIDIGGPISLADAQADIRIEALDDTRAAVCVAGARDLGVIVSNEEVVPAAIKLMRAFAALRSERPFDLRRMRHVVASLGLEAVLREAQLTAQPYRERPATPLGSVLGARAAQRFVMVGLAAPCGRWSAADLAALADVAEAHGGGRATPTHLRLFLIEARNAGAAQALLDAARARGFIVAGDDPRLAVVACPGAPECSQARGETRAALARLAPLAQKIAGKDGVGLHISGCAKGCARPGAAPVTLVADHGRFDLIEKGGAGDAPVSRGLDIAAVESALARAEGIICPTP